jgi:hypothetical protein
VKQKRSEIGNPNPWPFPPIFPTFCRLSLFLNQNKDEKKGPVRAGERPSHAEQMPRQQHVAMPK